MRQGPPSNLVASIRQRLLTFSQERGEDFALTLTRYGVERFLFRLSRSEHAQRFVLKGAMLFAVWLGQPFRPTRDLDLLGYGDGSAEELRRVFASVCEMQVEPDGLEWDPASMRIEEIRGVEEYRGQRVRLLALLGNARISLQIDVGFGDAVIPPADEVEYPTILDLPAPRIRAYPREAVVAEKFQAMVVLGIVKSRMKDFYDVDLLARTFPFEGARLSRAIQATFDRRQTSLPTEVPSALSDEFLRDRSRLNQWEAFLRKATVDPGGRPLDKTVVMIRSFVMPPTAALARQEDFDANWPPGGPWQPS